jgi:hypothetical protein
MFELRGASDGLTARRARDRLRPRRRCQHSECRYPARQSDLGERRGSRGLPGRWGQGRYGSGGDEADDLCRCCSAHGWRQGCSSRPRPAGVGSRGPRPEREPQRAPGTEPGPAEWFTRDVWIESILAPEGDSQANVGVVHFAPGARSAWHSHAGGQTLYVTEGRGHLKSRGDAVVELRGWRHPPDCRR